MIRIQRTIERLESRHLMASDWQNASLMRDVDNSSLVTPLDVLLLINNLNSNGSRELPTRAQNSGDPFYDVDGQTLASSIVTVSLDASGSIPRSVVADTEGRFTVQLPLAEGLQIV